MAPQGGRTFPLHDTEENNFFTHAMGTFMEVDSVSGNVPGEDGAGLGPTFNGNSCARAMRRQPRAVAAQAATADRAGYLRHRQEYRTFIHHHGRISTGSSIHP